MSSVDPLGLYDDPACAHTDAGCGGMDSGGRGGWDFGGGGGNGEDLFIVFGFISVCQRDHTCNGGAPWSPGGPAAPPNPPDYGPGTGGGGGGSDPGPPVLRRNPVPANPCYQGGGAPNPSWYVAQVQQAGNQFPGSPFNSANSLMNQMNQFTTLLSFQRGGSLDAQPLGGSRAYGNYVYGAALNAAGYSLSFTLFAANLYGSTGHYGPGDGPMDSNYPNIPAANVANITNGYNAQQNGAVCHK